MAGSRSLSIYLPIYAFGAKARMGAATGKSLQKKCVKKSLFLIRASDESFASSFSAELAGGFHQKQELGAILTT